MAKTNLKTVSPADETDGETITMDTNQNQNNAPTGNVLETPPAKEVPKAGMVIRGSASAIPEALLNRGKTTYNWSDMGVGDHKLVPKAEAAQARASAYAYARNKGHKFGSQAHGADKNFIEIWRLPDPAPTNGNGSADETADETENETTDF